MALKAVLFDMDGVIVDTEPLHKKAYLRVFSDEGVKVDDTFYASFNGASTKKVFEMVATHFQLETPVEEMMARKRGYFKEYFYSDTTFGMIPGVLSLIEHYHRNEVTLVVASSATRTTIDMVFDKFDLNKYFAAVVSGADLVESKPNPEIFLRAAELASESLENCLVIEDATNGILAAHRAGIFCAAYKSVHTHNQDYSLANLVVNEFSELELEKLKSYFQ